MLFPVFKFEEVRGEGEGEKAGKLLEFEFASSGDRGLVDIADDEDEDPAGLVKREDDSEDDAALESPPEVDIALEERMVIRGVSQRVALPEPRRRKLPPLCKSWIF